MTVMLKKGTVLAVLGVVLLAVTLGVAVYKFSAPVYVFGPVETNGQRVEFLAQFGCQVEPEPIEEADVEIPGQFDAVYENYEKVLRKDGMSLKPYRGQTLHRYTYAVLNHSAGPGVRANLLINENKVVGGDISTVALDGFMHSFGEFSDNVRQE